MRDELAQLGLNTLEIDILEDLVRQGPCFVNALVKTTKLHRQQIYRALESLIKSGFVTQTQRNGKRFYSLDNAGSFVRAFRERELAAERLYKRILASQAKQNEAAFIFAGKESYEKGLADFRKEAELSGEYIVIGGQPESWYQYTRPFFEEHVAELQRLKRRGVDIRIVFFESEKTSAEKFILPYANNPYLMKIVPSIPRLPHTTWLSGNNVYIQTPTDEPLVVRFRSKSLATNYRQYFDELWRSAR